MVRRQWWLALARVPGTVKAGVTSRFAARDGEERGRRLEAALAGEGLLDGEDHWGRVFDEARARLGRVEREIARAARVGARLVDFEDEEYPARLREIQDPPPAIFVRGTLDPGDERAAAIIGSREATRYGIAVTQRIVPGLVARGVTIVSGMARGIDAAGHRAALGAGGRTIAVLGTGIDRSYPSSSRDLYERIPERGAVISEVAPGTEPMPWVFPNRNRIISALAKVVVIVEARAKSGTAVTAHYALKQGRDVGVVPGDVDIARSAGTNALLFDGAFVVRSADDVLCHGFGEVRPVEPPPEEREAKAGAGVPPPPGLDADSARVWEVLGRGGSTLEALVSASGLRTISVIAAVGRMERTGLVRTDAWGKYVLGGGVEIAR